MLAVKKEQKRTSNSLQVDDDDNPAISPIIEELHFVKKPKTTVAIKKLIRLKDLLPKDIKSFFRQVSTANAAV